MFYKVLVSIVLKCYINSFSLLIIEEKLTTIKNLLFLQTAKDLKIYLSIIKWLKDKVPFYFHILQLLQDCKINLFKRALAKGNLQKTFAAK
jgi:hypothetical protein